MPGIKQLSLFLLAAVCFTSCIKTKTAEVYDDYISLGPEDHFEVLYVNMERNSMRVSNLLFQVNYQSDTIVFRVNEHGLFQLPNSGISIVSDAMLLMDEHAQTHWESTADSVDLYLYIDNPLPLQFKLEFNENAHQRDSYGAKQVYLDITAHTQVIISGNSRSEKAEMDESKDKMVEQVNMLMQGVNDADPYMDGIQPFEASSYVYMP